MSKLNIQGGLQMNEVVEINLLTNEVTVRDIESNEKFVVVFTDARARELYEDFTQNGNEPLIIDLD